MVTDMDSDWCRFYLDSYHTFINMPGSIPSNIVECYKKTVRIDRPPETTTKFFRFKYQFSIVHSGSSPDHSVGHGSDEKTSQRGKVMISLNGRDEKLAGRTRHDECNLQSFKSTTLNIMSDCHFRPESLLI